MKSICYDKLTLTGALTSNDMAFESQTLVLNQGGTVTDHAKSISVKDADTAVIITTIGTDYIDRYPDYKGDSSA